MAFRRKDRSTTETAAVDPDVAPAVPPGQSPRPRGPWDRSEKEPDDGPATVDLGSLVIRGRAGFTIQIPADGENGAAGSVVMTSETSGLELRAFAAPRSGGLWPEVMADIVAEVGRTEGTVETLEGPYGDELHVRVPVTMPDGSDGFQPSRILGIDGPRWLLRATVLGQEALEPDDESALMDALREVVVVRGTEPRMAREPLLLTIPATATVVTDEE